MKYGNINLGQIEAGINIIGGEEAFMKLLRGELVVSEPTQKWKEFDGIIYFSVTSNGMTGAQWEEHSKKKGTTIGSYAKSLLLSDDFKPTNGVTTEVAVMKGMLWNDSDRSTKNIRAAADKKNFSIPNAEISCLIRDKFTDEEIKAMGLLWIVGMHEPIKASDGDLRLLGVSAYDVDYQLNAYLGGSDDEWLRQGGFAFSVSQFSAEVLES